MHIAEEAQDTDSRPALASALGLGVLCLDHSLPAHLSASVTPTSPEGRGLAPPTATQAIEEMHETPFRELSVAPVGLGEAWMVHSLTVQVSASVLFSRLCSNCLG